MTDAASSDGAISTLRLTVERMAYGADAVAHDGQGKTVFVSGAAPGDVVDAQLVTRGRSFDRARVVSVVAAGPNRVVAACPHAGICGGCPWAHLTRQAQLTAKRSAVVDALVHVGGMTPQHAGALVADCIDLGRSWGYRNKVELGFARQGSRAVVGLHSVGRTGVIKVDACPLLSARDPKLVKAIAGATTYLAGADSLGIVRVGIRSSMHTGNLEVALWTTPGPFPRGKAAKILTDATKGCATSIVRVLTKGPAKARRAAGVERLAGKGYWEERVGTETMRLSAPSFFQVNTVGAERLAQLVLDALSPAADDEAMDLYSGAGTFTLPLARRAGFVSAVESYGPAVRDLRRNLETANLKNVDSIGGDAWREFPDTEADIIVVDPPRAGLDERVVERLSEQRARAVAYVSCDPATLARDLRRFATIGRLAPVNITPVDLFPQTYHVETVTILERRARPAQ